MLGTTPTASRRRRGGSSRGYLSSPDAVARARADAGGYAAWSGASDEQVHAIRLAVSEAVTNSVVHAYPAGTGLIHLTADRSDSELTVLVADDGVGLRNASANAALSMGWMIIADAADHFTVTPRDCGGTLVEMRWSMIPMGAGVFAIASDIPTF
jgi:anti-sigma regulatory factor (Ser/Thr protein kinase)